jgi:hypothetical protein
MWGTNLFQSVYAPRPGLLGAIPSLPEWYLAIGLLAVVSALGLVWPPLLLALPLLGLALAATLLPAVLAAKSVSPPEAARRGRARLRFVGVTGLLHAIQPPARLWGRVRHGLTPWRRRGNASPHLPWPRTQTVWSEQWRPPERWLADVEASLRASGATVLRGGSFDSWDLEVRGGALGSVRIRALVEEHGNGRQFVRLRSYPRLGRHGLAAVCGILLLGVLIGLTAGRPHVLLPIGIALAVALRGLQECAGATGEVLDAIATPRASRAVPGRKLERASTIHS